MPACEQTLLNVLVQVSGVDIPSIGGYDILRSSAFINSANVITAIPVRLSAQMSSSGTDSNGFSRLRGDRRPCIAYDAAHCLLSNHLVSMPATLRSDAPACSAHHHARCSSPGMAMRTACVARYTARCLPPRTTIGKPATPVTLRGTCHHTQSWASLRCPPRLRSACHFARLQARRVPSTDITSSGSPPMYGSMSALRVRVMRNEGRRPVSTAKL